jgi:hypothetical protein
VVKSLHTRVIDPRVIAGNGTGWKACNEVFGRRDQQDMAKRSQINSGTWVCTNKNERRYTFRLTKAAGLIMWCVADYKTLNGKTSKERLDRDKDQLRRNIRHLLQKSLPGMEWVEGSNWKYCRRDQQDLAKRVADQFRHLVCTKKPKGVILPPQRRRWSITFVLSSTIIR